MQIIILQDIAIIFAIAIAVTFIFQRLKIPALLGLIITGVLTGPHLLGLVSAVEEVHVLSEIGIVMLLFSVGIEFSFSKLTEFGKGFLLGGSMQVGFTIILFTAIAYAIGFSLGQSLFIGMLFSLSSTAIVLKIFQQKGEIDAPQGRLSLTILIFQDLSVVLMMLLIPILTGMASNASGALLPADGNPSVIWQLVKGMIIIVLVLIAARKIIPWLLYRVALSRSRELFLMAIMLICLAVAWITSNAGLSLALGAFLAGLIIAESEYSNQALSSIQPFRDVFINFFFVSIGMMIEIGFVISHLWLILGLTLLVMVLKSGVAGLATLILGYPLRIAILVGLALCQVGEFSFLLSRSALEQTPLAAGISSWLGVPQGEIFQVFWAVFLISMMVTPFIMNFSGGFARSVAALKKQPGKEEKGVTESNHEHGLSGHVVIIGFGVVGRNLAKLCKSANILYTIIELNPDTVKNEKAKGEPIIFGDATMPYVLEKAGVHKAKLLVSGIPDPRAVRQVIESSKALNPALHIVARTRYVSETKTLHKLGADEIVPEEFETAVEIFTRVLEKYDIPKEKIIKFAVEAKTANYQLLMESSQKSSVLEQLRQAYSNYEVRNLRITERTDISGKSLSSINLRKNWGLTVMVVQKSEEVIANPDGDTILDINDRVIVYGEPSKINIAVEKLRLGEE